MNSAYGEAETMSLIGEQFAVQAGRRSQKCLTLLVSLRALLMFAWLAHELVYYDYRHCSNRSYSPPPSLSLPIASPSLPREVESPEERNDPSPSQTTTIPPSISTPIKLKRIIRRRKKQPQSGTGERGEEVLEKTVDIVPLHATGLNGSKPHTINTKTTWNRQVREFKPMGIHPISGRRWRIVRRKKVKRAERSEPATRYGELEQSMNSFESSTLCVGRVVFDAWCAAHCLLATAPFIVGVWLRRRLLLLLHVALDGLLILLLFILCIVAACFVLLALLLVKEETLWRVVIHGLGFTAVSLAALLTHLALFTKTLQWAEDLSVAEGCTESGEHRTHL